MLFEDSLEMESVELPGIFDTTVINNQEKHNGAPLVAPQARSSGALEVAMLLETFLEESCSGPRWDNLPSGHQRYPLKGIRLGYMYWVQKQSSE